MKRNFNGFQVVEATDRTLTIRMDSGTQYTLWRGLDKNYKRLFKLQIKGVFYRTPDTKNRLARNEYTGDLIQVEITRYNVGSLTKAGW